MRWLAWRCYQVSSWAHTQSALWLAYEQGKAARWS